MVAALQMPQIHADSSARSRAEQRRYMRWIRVRIAGLLVAAVGGATHVTVVSTDASGWVVVLGFTAALIVEILLLTRRPQEAWWQARAVAEATKTLVWRFAVGGDPFGSPLSADVVEREFHQRLNSVVAEAKGHVTVGAGSGPSLITDDMREWRSRPFAQRREAYLTHRTQNQRDWYATKAAENEARERAWSLVMILCEALAVVVAAIAVGKGWAFDLAGVGAAVVGGAATWVAAKQHAELAVSYRVAAAELAMQADVLGRVSEDQWAAAVGDAEEAISREHSLWLARRDASVPIRLGR